MPPPAEKPRDMVPADEVEAIIAARVKAAVHDSVSEIREMVAEQLAGQRSSSDGADGSWMQALAMQIANLTDQGTGRKRIAPEEMRKRELARDRMMDLIAGAQARGDEPLYRLRSIVYLGEQKVMPSWIDRDHRQQPTEIGWLGVPNLAMDPVDSVACDIYAAFSEWIGGVEKPPAEMDRLSPSGLVLIRRGPTTERQQTEAQHTGAETAGRGSLTPTIRGRGAPSNVVERHILGTVMPPARENA